MSKEKKFIPDWYHEKAPERSYRSILKWGDPEAFKALVETAKKAL